MEYSEKTMADYREALEELYPLRLFGTKLGLNNIRCLLKLLGDPQQGLAFYHIAGTNGKGSTAAILQRLLMTTHRRVGLFTSPHLLDFRERIRVNDRLISPRETVAGVREILPLLDQVAATPGCSHPTYFEAVTALACVYFQSKGVETVVWEVGLGGRLDATNAVSPRVTVITTIGLEHQAYLGRTRDLIAREKGGIIKTGIPLVTALPPGRALDRLKRICRSRRSFLIEVKKHYRAKIHSRGLAGQVLTVTGPNRSLANIFLPLPGEHQVANCLTAIAAWEQGDPVADQIPPAQVSAAIGSVSWPGRLEYFPGPPEVILDGAHNRDGARVLARSLRELIPGRSLILILGILGDKDVRGICRPLLAGASQVVAVAPPSNRALPASSLAWIVRGQLGERKIPVLARKSLESALEYCHSVSSSGPSGEGITPVICVAGSLRLIAPAREFLLRRTAAAAEKNSGKE